MKLKETSKIVQFARKWRRLRETDEKYAEAFFMGGWSYMTDDEAAKLLMVLEHDDFKVIIDYPIWS